MRPRVLTPFVVLSTVLLVVGATILSGAVVVAAQETGTATNSDTDTDGDGLSDEEEMQSLGTDPEVADTDGDGLSDGEEVNEYQTNPTNADTDGDGLSDGEEINQYETDPTKSDTDGDGVPDGEEVEAGTDPLDQNTSTAQPAPENPEEEDNPLSNIPTGVLLSFVLGAVVGGVVVAFVRR